VTDSAVAVDGGRLTPAGFSTLYQRHHRALWCIAAAIVKDRELAYDVVQEAAVIALGKLNEFDPTTSFPAWCGQIVRFAALNQRKRNVRSHVRPTDPTVMAATAPAIAGGGPSLAGAFSGRLAEALETLDETARACLLMKIVMDMSYKHIAEALAIPEGTAMSHVHRSRQALRRQLEGAEGANPEEGGVL
jgi:RNA polymerase sigma-70 factor (ECF subfamily)